MLSGEFRATTQVLDTSECSQRRDVRDVIGDGGRECVLESLVGGSGGQGVCVLIDLGAKELEQEDGLAKCQIEFHEKRRTWAA